MLKTINVTFEDEDFSKLEKEKGALTWHDYILELSKKMTVVEKGSQR